MSPRTSPRTVERLGLAVSLAALSFLVAASAFAGTFYSQGSLDASVLASWNSARAGGGTGPADFTSGDVFVVQDAHVLALSSAWTISGAGAGLQVESGGTLVIPSGQVLAVSCPVTNSGTLDVQGTLRFDEGGSFDPGSTVAPAYSAGASLVYANSGAVGVGGEWTGTGSAGPGVPANVSIAGSGSVTLPSADRGISGSLTISSGTLALNAASGTLEVGGDWTVSGGATFTSNGRTVRFNGAADQNVTSGGDAFEGVVISKTGGKVVLLDDLAVDGALELQSGVVETGSSALVIGPTGSVSRTSGHVVGLLRKPVAAGASSQTFEIGDASSYTPVEVNGQGVGFSSAFTLTASTSAGDHAALASSGISPGRSVNRTYTLTAPGYSGGPFDLVFNFAPADVDGGATPSRFVIRRHSSGTWAATTTSTRTATSTRATGLTAFSDFAVGEQAIDHYDVTADSPQMAGDVFTTTVTARDVLNLPVVDDHSTSVTMTSDGAAEFDADGNAAFGDNAKTLSAGTFGIATRDGTPENITITATDANSRTGERAGMVIDPALSITTTSLPNGNIGEAYSQALAAAGGTAPYTNWTVTAGALPAGLTLDNDLGIISGTPTTVETQAFTVQVGDDAGHTATRALSITVDAVLGISTATLPNGTVGDAYSQALAATGGTAPYTNWTVTVGVLPAGLALDNGTGVISGTPTTAETQAFTVRVSDAASHTASRTMSVTVDAALDITTTTLPSGTAGEAYSQALVAAGGSAPYSNWTVTVGTLPAGLALDSGTGVISGTPTTAGTQAFTVQVGDDAGHTATRALSIAVGAGVPAQLAVVQSPSNTVAGAVLSPHLSVQLRDAFGNPAHVTGVEVDVELASGPGLLLGTLSRVTDTDGLVDFDDLVVQQAGAARQLTVSSAGLASALSSSFDVLPAAAASVTFSQQPASALVGAVLSPAVVVHVQDAFGNNVPGEPVSLALVGTGTLGGYSPTSTDASGLAAFPALTVSQAGAGKRLEASAGAVGPVPSAPFDITCPAITLLPASLPNGTQGSAYSETITAAGGTGPYGFVVSAGSLPAGLALSGAGALTGTPTATGTFGFTVTATDAFGCSGDRAYTLGVDLGCPATAVLPSALPAASVAVPYAQVLSASGGTAPFTFAVTAGALPAGLTLSGSGGLAGTPSSSGPFTFTVGVTDANLCTGSREYTLDVLAIPSAIANLSAATLLSGNDANGTAKVAVTFTLPPGAATAEVYRAGFGGYPRYDNAGGVVPAIPSYPPGPPWTLTAVTSSGQADEPAARDFWYYVAFAKNAAGGRSGVSNRSSGALDYHLGDVSNGLTVGQGNNFVGDEDVSLLGSNYGISEPELTTRAVHYLDVGPTTDLLVTSRPFTDGRIDFEDFIVFATNFYVVSAPQLAAVPAEGSEPVADELRLEAPAVAEAGRTFAASLRFGGSGAVQGFSATLAWDAAVVEPVAVTPAGWVEAQNALVLSPRPGVVDAAVLGVRSRGMTGEGEIATVTFRVLRAGDPGIRFAQVLARDARNRPVELGTALAATGAPRTWTTMLAAPWPNPARRSATFEFSLASAGRVDLAVYSVDGRRVKTLASGEREAGAWREAWDGNDESGRVAAPGLYYAQLQAGGLRFTRRLVLLR